MKVIPYASAIGSIKYAMLWTRPIVDHWTLVKIIISRIRIYFSIMEVIKELLVKSYINASFYTDPDDSKSQSGYILKVGAIS